MYSKNLQDQEIWNNYCNYHQSDLSLHYLLKTYLCQYMLWLFVFGPHQANLVLIAYASIRAVSPEPPLLAHTDNESTGTLRQKARSLAPLNGWACAIKICHDGMLEDTNSLEGAHFIWNMIIIVLFYFLLKADVKNNMSYISQIRHI